MTRSRLSPSDLVKVFCLSVPVLLMAVGGGWFGDAMGERFNEGLFPWTGAFWEFESWRWAKFGGGLVLFLAGAGLIYWFRREYLPVQVLNQTSEVQPARVLVTTVSRRNGFELDDARRTLILQDGRVVRLTGRLEEDCEAEGQWNWQQLLRGIRPHCAKLERIHLIGSEGGSHEQLGECAAFLRRYLPACEIVCSRHAVDFEDIDAIREALDVELHAAREALPGLRDRDIMLDCTGGQKTTSIAVALYTTRHRGLRFQYVNNQGEMLSFNVTVESEPEIG